MMSRFSQWAKEYSLGIAWSLAFGALLFVAILSYGNFQNVARTAELVTEQYEVLLELEAVVESLVLAETNQRGYLMTELAEYRKTYEEAVAELPSHLRKVENRLKDDPEQLRRFRVVEELARQRLAEMQYVISLRKEQNIEAARRRIEANRTNQLMENLRRAVGDIREQERLILGRRQSEAQLGRQNAALILISGTIVLAVMTVAAFIVAKRQLLFQAAMERQLTAANEELEARVVHRTEALRATNESLRDEILERTRLEDQAKQIAEELQRSNRELEQFAFVASHDLQEPLRKIQAFSDRLKTKYGNHFDGQGKEYLERIVASADRMRNLINDLLTYSRASTKSQDFAPVDLKGVIEDVLTDLEGRMTETSGKVEVGSLPALVADGPQMRQLFQNLIANGLKFHRPETPPVVRITGGLLPSEDGQPERCQVTVADNGIGFDNVYAERIFQLFQRLHGRSEYEGTGMGLAICRKIVERHGGTIKADGIPGQGATFTVILPCRPNPSQE
jgi:signal transduction histidine kinase